MLDFFLIRSLLTFGLSYIIKSVLSTGLLVLAQSLMNCKHDLNNKRVVKYKLCVQK